MAPSTKLLSVVVVSFNTRDLTRRCLEDLRCELTGLDAEVLVVDNASRDGSADMIAGLFPDVNLLRSEVNLGFAGANNVALEAASGRFLVLLNSDAFFRRGALRRAIAHMEESPAVGLGGAKLVGEDSSWQPSCRLFPSLLNELLVLSGLAARYPHSRFFGRVDRTWEEPLGPVKTDWVPGAFSIIRREALDKAGLFDEQLFLYYEEVDLCRRIKQAGFEVVYWPEVEVIHLGGESSKSVSSLSMSTKGAQLTLWRLRSQYLYYRKHHGSVAWAVMVWEKSWHKLRRMRNSLSGEADRRGKANESESILALLAQAWKETNGGRISPARPW